MKESRKKEEGQEEEVIDNRKSEKENANYISLPIEKCRMTIYWVILGKYL